MSSTNATSLHQPDWLESLGGALDALAVTAGPAPAPATESGQAASETRDAQPEQPVDLFETHEGRGGPAAIGAGEGFDAVDTLKFTRRELEQYGDVMSKVIEVAQLDERFVSRDYLTKGFVGMKALGMMPREQRVRIHGETGLPTQGSWLQLNAVRNLAQAVDLRDARYQQFNISTPISAAVAPMLVEVPDPPFGKMSIEVAEIDGQACRFRVHIDAWRDPGLIVRTTLHIDQRKGDSSHAPLLTLNKAGEWRLEPTLKKMLDPLAKVGAAHLAFVASKHCGPALTGVTQGLVGPIYFDGIVKPEIIEDFFEVEPNGLIGCFTAFELHREPESAADGAKTAADAEWSDPDDQSLEELKASGWSAKVDKLWVCSKKLRDVLEIYKAEYDTTLLVRPFSTREEKQT